ncbi:MAG TPA: methyltransferase domain-containing protein [Microvirga sp.]|nr:methyltransferase domain-containing protein [Microvirga sp.]
MTRRDFSRRSAETELMDVEAVGLEDFRACLRDLATVNTLTLTRAPTVAWLRRAARGMPRGARLSLLDVGFGHGDMLRRIYRWCSARGLEPDLIGIDLNPSSTASAREATPPEMRIDYRTADVFAFEPDRPLDFIVSSQFAHHLSDVQVVAFMRWMERLARRGWFISDLHRHPVPYHLFRLLARLARWHRFVQHDGPVSIARSFRPEDWRRFAEAAGLDPGELEIRWHVPFRLTAGRIR